MLPVLVSQARPCGAGGAGCYIASRHPVRAGRQGGAVDPYDGVGRQRTDRVVLSLRALVHPRDRCRRINALLTVVARPRIVRLNALGCRPGGGFPLGLRRASGWPPSCWPLGPSCSRWLEDHRPRGRHLAVDAEGWLLALVVTAASVSDKATCSSGCSTRSSPCGSCGSTAATTAGLSAGRPGPPPRSRSRSSGAAVRTPSRCCAASGSWSGPSTG